jgi:TonB family protein
VSRARSRPTANAVAAVSAKPSKTIIRTALVTALIATVSLSAQSLSHSQSEPESSAVDLKGVRHHTSDYGDERPPWDTDLIKFVKPDYPTDARARHMQGTAAFRITLDVNTGSAANVTRIKSTGSTALDDAAMRAIRLWRWRPGRWKEIDIPVTFTLQQGARYGSSGQQLETRGRGYYRNGDNDSAIEAATKAIRLRPTLPRLYVERGAAYQNKGDGTKRWQTSTKQSD